jgi:hypothetical protein
MHIDIFTRTRAKASEVWICHRGLEVRDLYSGRDQDTPVTRRRRKKGNTATQPDVTAKVGKILEPPNEGIE